MEHTLRLPCGLVLPNGEVEREVVIREITGKIQKKLGSPALQNNPAKLFKTIAESCIVRIGNEPMNASLLPALNAGDRDYILMEVFKASRDSRPVSVKLECSNCGHHEEGSFGMDDIGVMEIPDDPSGLWEMVSTSHPLYPKRRVWTAENSSLGITVKFFFPRVGDKGQITGVEENLAEAQFDYVAGSIYQWEDSSGVQAGPFDGSFFDDKSLRIIEWVMGVFGQVIPGPDLSVTYTCSACGAEGRAMMNISDFFDPAPNALGVGSMLTKRSGSSLS